MRDGRLQLTSLIEAASSLVNAPVVIGDRPVGRRTSQDPGGLISCRVRSARSGDDATAGPDHRGPGLSYRGCSAHARRPDDGHRDASGGRLREAMTLYQKVLSREKENSVGAAPAGGAAPSARRACAGRGVDRPGGGSAAECAGVPRQSGRGLSGPGPTGPGRRLLPGGAEPVGGLIPRPCATSAWRAQGLGKKTEAAGHFRRALELRPDFATAHNNLGIVLRDLGQMEAGGRWSTSAGRSSPRRPASARGPTWAGDAPGPGPGRGGAAALPGSRAAPAGHGGPAPQPRAMPSCGDGEAHGGQGLVPERPCGWSLT